MSKASTPPARFHPRNRHQGHYDLPRLAQTSPALGRWLRTNPNGEPSLDFAEPEAVKALNRALLTHWYALRDWDIPNGYLCPPVPGRADLIHCLADLLGESHNGTIPTGPGLVGLDIGTGTNLIYPLIGTHEYGWRFVGSDIDPTALANAQRLVSANALPTAVELRQQSDPQSILHGIIGADERFDFSLCNPPFHPSAAQARDGSRRKWRNLGQPGRAQREPLLNFGGQANELHCPGGEAGFLGRLAEESAAFTQQVFWFTALVSKAASLPALQAQLQQLGARDVRIVPMQQGHKHSRLLAWTFLDKKQRRRWRRERWPQPCE